MSVVNGQIANQTTFNNAFMSRLAATTQTVAQIQLENAAVESGAFVANVQRAINKAFQGVGATGEADTTINTYANHNYILNGDNRKVAVGKLDAQLKTTQTDLDAAEATIINHENRIDAAEATIINHENRIDAAEATIIDHETRIDSAEATIIDHETRIDSAEATIINHEGRITTAESTNTTQNTRLTNLESNTMTIGGNKTFSGNMVVQGNFEVQGTTTYINTANLEVEDQNILVNKLGTDGSSAGAGLTVERPSGNAALQFDNTLASKWKIGLVATMWEVIVSGVAQTISGLKTFSSGIATNTVAEATANSGVTVDGVLIKDGLVDNRDVSADGTTLDGHTTTLGLHGTRLTNLESNAQTIGGLKTFTNGIATNTIAERTAAAGVTIDGVLLKDGLTDGRDVSADGTTLDGHTTTLGTHTTQLNDHETRIDNLELTDVDHASRLNELETLAMTINGNKTFAGATTFNGTTTFSQDIYVSRDPDASTGSDVIISNPTEPLLALTGVGLASIGSISLPSNNQVFWVINQTGAPVTIKNELASATAATRIKTGTNADAVLAADQVAYFVYDLTSQRWYLASLGGATGGGGGSTGKKTVTMNLNGLVGGAAAYNGVDGLWVAPSNCQITNVYMYQDTAGSGGTTTLDLKVKPFLSGAFTSIFLTTPKMTNLAGANAWGGVGDTVTGFTAPVLTSLPFAVAAKSAIRMDLIAAQTGSAAGVGLIIEYEEL